MRPLVCKENPNLDPVEVTKLVAAKWYSLANEEKQPYMEEARLDRERFKRELKEFNKDNPEANGIPMKKSKSKSKGDTTASKSTLSGENLSGSIPKKETEGPKVMNFIGTDSELPIFTDVFLEHNKIIETELKMLRKSNMESENSVLMKHVENMTIGVSKVEGEIAATKQKNLQLEVYLTKLKCVLASGLNSISLPTLKSGASIENIDKYMSELCSPDLPQDVSNKASEIIRKLDLKISP